MTTPTSTAQEPVRSTTPRGSLLVLAALVGLWVVWAAVWLVAPDRNPGGQCEGLGFGCTLTPQDLTEFAGLVLLAPFSVLVLVLTLVVRLVLIARGSPRTVWDAVVVVLVLLVGGAWLVGTMVGGF